MPPVLRRVIFSFVPFVIVISSIIYAFAGEEGILNSSALRQELLATQSKVDLMEAKNTKLRNAIQDLREDPDAVRRLAAEELLIAEPGSTIYTFGE